MSGDTEIIGATRPEPKLVYFNDQTGASKAGIEDTLTTLGTSSAPRLIAVGATGGASVSTRRLYSAAAEIDPELDTALTLLAEAEGRAKEALGSTVAGELISADIALQHLRALMPELCCLSSLGDGFDLLVFAVRDALDAKKEAFLTEDQASEIYGVVKRLAGAPFISFTAATEIVSAMRRLDLEPISPALPLLVEMLDDDRIPGHDNTD